jgi:hypothetical protein
MSVYKTTINSLPLLLESRQLTPQVKIFMVSVQGDPVKFPMICKKEFGGWFFVDKMTLVEFTEIEKEISEAIDLCEGIIVPQNDLLSVSFYRA